jgi:hypothetical protein
VREVAAEVTPQPGATASIWADESDAEFEAFRTTVHRLRSSDTWRTTAPSFTGELGPPRHQHTFAIARADGPGALDRSERPPKPLGSRNDIRHCTAGLVELWVVATRPVEVTRLAAFALVHGVPEILTLNVSDFARFDGLSAVHPSSVN